MTIRVFTLPQLILTRRSNEKGRFLEHLTCEAGRPDVNVSVMDDFKKDTRINLIEFMTDNKEKVGSLYYSETLDNKKIITLNLGYPYNGPIFTKDYKENELALAEHLPKKDLREKHIERINKLENIKENLIPEEVALQFAKIYLNKMAFDDFKHNITFHTLCDLIQRKRQLDKSSRIYVEWAQEFFKEILKSIDSILEPREGEGFYFMEPPLKSIIKNYNIENSVINVDLLSKLKNDMNSIVNNLENFKKDENSFYKTKEAGETFNSLIKFLPKHGGFSEYYINKDLDGDD
jgi:hypothetical protein